MKTWNMWLLEFQCLQTERIANKTKKKHAKSELKSNNCDEMASGEDVAVQRVNGDEPWISWSFDLQR